MEPSRQHAGLLLIRAWVEPWAVPSLRIVVTSVPDVESQDDAEHFATTSIDDVNAAVRAWLEEIRRRSEAPG